MELLVYYDNFYSPFIKDLISWMVGLTEFKVDFGSAGNDSLNVIPNNRFKVWLRTLIPAEFIR